MNWNRRNKSKRKRVIQQIKRLNDEIDGIGNTYNRLKFIQEHSMKMMAKRLDMDLVGMFCNDGSKKSKHKIKN